MLKSALVVSALAAVSAGANLMRGCSDANLQGYCYIFTGAYNICYSAGSLSDTLSSVSVRIGLNCVLYIHTGCEGQSVTVTKNVNFLENFNDVTSSFRCQPNDI
ncbi:hypothetical protein BGZ96_010389 [Linnemannia gamsii]|uniref:Uncharacterized protein n=1 Tax=Linnemannia gamsii TaxID=64522 RepID=A0ABQ7JUG8_9FUNG|nr:hypothetical protein BGZ96_010389 [Linnemannia gamsii]